MAVGFVPLTNRTHSKPAANIGHRNAVDIVKNSVAFYGGHRVVSDVESVEYQEGIFVRETFPTKL